MSWLERHITLQMYDDSRAERENALTHFLGLALSLAGLALVVNHLDNARDSAVGAGMIVFAVCNILLYAASGFYHCLRPGNAKRICRVLDHSNIYFLIAGTYTPLLMYAGTDAAFHLAVFMWLTAIAGIAFTIFFWDRFKAVHLMLYLLMGWTIVFLWQDIIPHLPRPVLGWLLAGGIIYSAGVVFYAMKKLPHYHSIWHLFVLAGSLCFYFGLYSNLLAN